MNILRHITAIITVALTAMVAVSQEAEPIRPVLSAYSIEGGTSHLADTYLTPLHYDGWHVGLGYERMQAPGFNPENWVMQLSARVNFDDAQNPARNATMLNLEAEAAWSIMRRWKGAFGAPKALTLGIGPGTSLRGGVLYLNRNGNNPAAAKGDWTLNASGFAAYNFNIGKLPITLRYEAILPVTGVFFTPEYGQLYYEIWLGDTGGLAQMAWWGNYFRIDNLLTADLRLGGTTLRIGYHNDIISTKAHDIVSRRITHAFTFALVTEWTSLSSRKKVAQSDARVISALY